jgi:hypothetical protein
VLVLTPMSVLWTRYLGPGDWFPAAEDTANGPVVTDGRGDSGTAGAGGNRVETAVSGGSTGRHDRTLRQPWRGEPPHSLLGRRNSVHECVP